MSTRLPPLGALRAFEASARHLSFKKAAAELHVSPAAISHQISTLEQYLGVHLFARLNRSLNLTDVGRAGLASISSGFQALQAGVEAMRLTQARATVSVSAGPAFAAKWLVPRLQRFVTDHPDIDVRIGASLHAVDGHNAEAQADAEGTQDLHHNSDIVVRFGDGTQLGNGLQPGVLAEELLAVNLTPVCNPRLLDGKQALRVPSDLRHHTLLHDDAVSAIDGHPDWAAWLKLAGAIEVNPGRGTHFTHGALALQAAADGLGVALAMDALAAADIATGRLAAPFAITLPLRWGYYMVSPTSRARVPAVIAFRDWLLREAQGNDFKN